MNNVNEVIYFLLENDLLTSLSYKDLISIKKTPDEYNPNGLCPWTIEYESYFNPHAKPKSLYDIELFNSLHNALQFFFLYLKKKNIKFNLEDKSDILVNKLKRAIDPENINNYNLDGCLYEIDRLVKIKNDLREYIEDFKKHAINMDERYLIERLEDILNENKY